MSNTAAILKRLPAALPEEQLDDWHRQFFDTQPLDVTVCIANWNCREQLRQCLDSLYYVPQRARFETIVVDNGSTDGSPALIAERFPHVHMICNERNAGFARANNQAARRARGRYLLFLNNDTIVPPGALRRLVDFLDAHPDAGMAGPRLRDLQGRVQVSCRPQPTVWSLLHRTTLLRWSGLFRQCYQRFRRTDLDDIRPRPAEVLMGAALIIRRQLFADIGGWDEDFEFGGEDLELCHRVRQRAAVLYAPEIEITHIGRASTRRNIAYVAPKNAIGFVRYLRKTGIASAPELFFYKLLVTIDAPLQGLVKLVQYLGRRLARRHAKAEKSLLEVRGRWHFLVRGLVSFWRA